MKLDKLSETLETGPLPKHVVDAYVDYLSKNGQRWSDAPGGRYVSKASYEGLDIYGLMDHDGTLISFAAFEPTTIADRDFYQLKVISTATGSVGNFFPQQTLLWTIKEYIGKPIVDYGAQSTHGSRFATALYKSGRFEVSWINVETGEQVPYDNSAQKRNVLKMTQWRVIIENAIRPSFKQTITENILNHPMVFELFEE